MPCTSDRRPMKFDGPTLRHRNAETTLESKDCAASGALKTTAAAKAARERDRCMTNPSGGGMTRPSPDITVTRGKMRVLAIFHPEGAKRPKDLLSPPASPPRASLTDRH